ncbi:uncharacterized protein LOC110943155 [Helianthus annuus]|uniref:uncharacterized protein LOC110943155 n=1 Tax=Helianthus annuus TaxID=4232 RepID=UPI000B907EC9|nr:uncharacterized protein LOC110943155 [Helianthus annuus]
MHGDVFITSKGSKPLNMQDLRDKPSLFSKPLNIDGYPLLARRGVTQQEQKVINVIDELEKVTVQVPLVISTNDSNDGQNQECSQPDQNPEEGENVKGFRGSYADRVKINTSVKREVNFRLLESLESVEEADVVIPKEAVRQVQKKFENVLYGYFLGDRLPFPVVDYYVKNVWAKYGFVKLMMNSDGFFFFKFDSKEGMLKVLENGPWLIRKVPLFLNVWGPTVSLKKEGIKSVPVWIRLHNVPLAVYTDDGLSLLASKVGIPKRLDSYTADMCIENWGRTSYARAMVEINADKELKSHVVVAIPKMDEEGFVMERVRVEYEWKPLRCETCCLFGHTMSSCPRASKEKAKQVIIDDEGFIMDKRKTAKHGFPQKKPKPKFVYKPKQSTAGASTSGTKNQGDVKEAEPVVSLHNKYDMLGEGGSNSGNLNGRSSSEPKNNAVDGTSKEDKNSNNQKSNLEGDEELIDPCQPEISSFMSANKKKAWNIRGLNRPLKQREVQQVVKDNRLSVCAILESHVEVSKLSKVCNRVFRQWEWTSNGGVCNRGTRIIIGWNNDLVDLMVLAQTDQVVHVKLKSIALDTRVFVSFVYAKNTYQERRELWRDLMMHKLVVNNQPWIVLGDFNSALYLDDVLHGSSNPTIGMRDFFECVQQMELLDIPGHGLHFTWNQKPKEGIGILKKIDRVMGNVSFLDVFPNAHVLYHPYRVSDHTPCILKLDQVRRPKPKPFKFANFIANKEEFKACVVSEWSRSIEGIPMISVVKKLRNLKSPLRKLLHDQGNLHTKVKELRLQLDDIHRQIDIKPFDATLRENETELIKKFHIASYDEESFLKQKAKLEWLSAGDGNTSFFHNFVKSRNARNKIHLIRDANGIQHEGVDVEKALVDHYANFLGIEAEVEELNMEGLFVNTVNPDLADHMIRPVTREEVKAAMFSIADNKAPGPDGYTSVFFKKAWDVVGDEVSTAILQFFENGKLLQQVNHTIIALIPKVSTPASVLEYRPISCCNVILKCISKILSERIKGSLGSLVDISQSAFIPGRKISDNILLTQELMHNYHLHKGKPRCAFKIDIQKAYDTVSWKFLKSILTRFGFPPKMVGWIMTCVSTVSFSLCINGNLCGYFKGRRGLRQGDPISPYLFTLVMEVLSLLLHKAADDHPAFRYHDKCKLQKIINVSFADDLFIFANLDLVSIRIMRDALELFTRTSGLNPNLAKSTVFFSNVSSQMKQEICSLLPFQEGELPVKYLGVPLISTKLSSKDCKILVDRVDKKIDQWLNKSLSLAGRLQLIKSVISAMHVYWASVFMLPVRIVTDIEKRMRNFLWSGGVAKGSTPKVAWKNVCLPKSEGGLGIRRIHDSNKALLANHVWSILTKRDSLWVKWVHSYRIKGRNFWELPFRGSMTWGWRKILSIRSSIRPFIWFLIRDGTEANAWNDNWCAYSPLRDFITPRRIHGAGFSMRSSVSDLIDTHNGWKWPIAWFDLYPVLINLMPPSMVHNVPDKLVWKNRQGNVSEFSASEAWESIRVRGEEVDWVSLVWFGQSIPRHSFHLWLVIKNKLKTQDRMGVWDAGSATNLNLMCCPLCNQGKDSRDHLFFRCSYALQVWNRVKDMAYMDSIDENWDSIIAWLSQHAINNSAKSIVSKLVVAASSYFIWQERNNRLFSRTQRNATVIANIVLHTVRLKLMTFKAGKSMKHPLMLERWKFQVKALSIDPG